MTGWALSSRWLVAAALGAVSTGCGGGAEAGRTGNEPLPAATSVALPAELAGLRVTAEELPNEAANESRTYAAASSVYALRQGNMLRATLQIIELIEAAPVDSARFRRGVVSDISAGIPTTIRLRGRDVFQSETQDGTRDVWFDQDRVLVLFVRRDFDRPRGLLQTVLAMLR